MPTLTLTLAQESAPAKPLRKQPPEYYQYQLKGVVVHSGTAFAGHYYSYIKAR
jgi:ubiquitin C-terminal hydrolase